VAWLYGKRRRRKGRGVGVGVRLQHPAAAAVRHGLLCGPAGLCWAVQAYVLGQFSPPRDKGAAVFTARGSSGQSNYKIQLI
jgi:nitrate/nitrite transporter NarK